ncbi:MAG: penicillin-binding protein 2 [Candidatus Omnitrophica bacterium]|nr:penicillin-binding protein 2 [Candidatus Omnitrophota bacterium]MCM8799213.1 penicillin-binding protein 2 [Candidatus Omnitrophota bacterium]
MHPLAVNLPAESLYAVPVEIKDKETVIKKLSLILKLDHSYLRERLFRNKAFVWIARKLVPSQVEQIKALKIDGLGFIKESKRAYPNGYLASHLLGFAGLDNVGLEGIELFYDNYLKGKAGLALFLRDAKGNKLELIEKITPPIDGSDLVLTIDETIQYIAERELDKVFKVFRAKHAMIIVINPFTGEILALANRPTFDLNRANYTDVEVRKNIAITDMFEPGSSFKIVTAAAILEEGKVKEDDRFFCENGSYRVGNHILHDHRPHGWLTFKEVIEQSSNIGTTKLAQILGPDIIYRYVKSFGFGSCLGIDLPGEIAGTIKSPKFWSKTSIGAVPIGHEVGVTALQLVSAISVIANGGLLMKPFILKEVRNRDGEKIKEFSPQIIRRVISEETSRRLKDILVGVVENGTGKLAKIEGFKVAGKTGTAQKIGSDGRYVHDRFVASFIGFVPADNPVIAICIVIDEPYPYYFGGVVCAPVFKRVASDILKYLQITSEKLVALKENEIDRVNKNH